MRSNEEEGGGEENPFYEINCNFPPTIDSAHFRSTIRWRAYLKHRPPNRPNIPSPVHRQHSYNSLLATSALIRHKLTWYRRLLSCWHIPVAPPKAKPSYGFHCKCRDRRQCMPPACYCSVSTRSYVSMSTCRTEADTIATNVQTVILAARANPRTFCSPARLKQLRKSTIHLDLIHLVRGGNAWKSYDFQEVQTRDVRVHNPPFCGSTKKTR